MLLEIWTINSLVGICSFIMFMGLSAMTVMNMLVGVLCEVVTEVGQNQRNENAVNMMKDTVLVELVKYDTDGNRQISKEELKEFMSNPATREVLKFLDVDTEFMGDVQEMLLPTQ